jgi:hypothetical protein
MPRNAHTRAPALDELVEQHENQELWRKLARSVPVVHPPSRDLEERAAAIGRPKGRQPVRRQRPGRAG